MQMISSIVRSGCRRHQRLQNVRYLPHSSTEMTQWCMFLVHAVIMYFLGKEVKHILDIDEIISQEFHENIRREVLLRCSSSVGAPEIDLGFRDRS